MRIVKGVELGETTVTATAKYGDRSTSSLPMPIQVFPPLQLEPRNITLVIGAKFQVRVVGGPQPSPVLEFALANGKVAETNSVGLVEALTLGSTRLVARAVGINKLSKKKVAYSEDQVDVHVVKFGGIRVKTPIRKMRVGTEMPILAVGTDEHQSPFSYGSASPALHYEWTSNNPDGADLKPVHHRNGLATGKRNHGVMRLVATRPGRVRISVKASITKSLAAAGDQYQFNRDRTFTDTVEVEMFDDLSLHKPRLTRNTLLMSHGSEYQLWTNRESEGAISYSVVTGGDRKAGVVTVTPSGLVRAGRNSGSAIILVEDDEKFGVTQRMSVVVDVKPVSYMMLNMRQSLSTTPKSQVTRLPKGFDIGMDVSFHDNTGLKFDATEHELQLRPSRFDSLLIRENEGKGNQSFNMELVREEFTVLRAAVSDDSSGLQDFVVLDVGRAIEPNVKVRNYELFRGLTRMFYNMYARRIAEPCRGRRRRLRKPGVGSGLRLRHLEGRALRRHGD